MGKRRTIINTLHAMRLFDVLPRKRSLTVLSYHRLGSAAKSPNFQLDPTVFGPTEDVFDAQMSWLATNAEPVSERDVLNATNGSTKLPKRAVLVTFDDAYKDQSTIGLPILMRHKIPAIFFVTPELINKRSLGFWDRINRAIKLTEKTEITVDGKKFSLADKESATRDITKFIKYRPDTNPYILTKKLEFDCETPPLSSSSEDAELMTWDEIKSLDQKRESYGLSVGAHGFTHRLLGTLTAEEQRWELVSAKESIEAELGHEIQSLAYPAGSYSIETPKIAMEYGYSALFTFESGINSSQLDPADLKRVPAGETTSIIACTASLPWALGDSFYP
jgi:peptidoglycan/xylan/chitin deacetylase (PgdA/CDA1 family)